MPEMPKFGAKKDSGGKFVQNMIKNNNSSKSGKTTPDSQKQAPGKKK